jgi:hypothetical protein
LAFINYDGCIALGIHLKYRNGDHCAICGAQSARSVTRYVITRQGPGDRVRTLAEPARGRYTYATAADAEARLGEIRESANRDAAVLEEFYPQAEVRAVECWPEDFDPKTCWFE